MCASNNSDLGAQDGPKDWSLLTTGEKQRLGKSPSHIHTTLSMSAMAYCAVLRCYYFLYSIVLSTASSLSGVKMYDVPGHRRLRSCKYTTEGTNRSSC